MVTLHGMVVPPFLSSIKLKTEQDMLMKRTYGLYMHLNWCEDLRGSIHL